MPTAFDDLLPAPPQSTGGAFDDLLPSAAPASTSAFADLLPELTAETVTTKLQDPAYTPSREEFEVWKDSEDAKSWFQPGEWASAAAAGVGAIKDTAVNAAKALFGPKSILEDPMNAGQTALEAGARGTLNDLELFGRKIPATVGNAVANAGETVIAALTGEKPDARWASFYSRKMAELNRAANPTGSPTFEWFTPATVPKELELQWRAEYQTQAQPAEEYQRFLSKRADQLAAVQRSQGQADLVPPVLGKADNAIAELGSLVVNPSSVATFGIGAAPRTGATILERGAAAAATGVGRAAGATGRAAQLVAKFPAAVVARGVELAGGTAETAAAAAKLVEGGSIGATLASPAIAVPGLTEAAIAMQAAKRGGQLIEAAGEASGAVGRALAQGPSRTGLLGTIATDGKAPEWIRKAAAATKAADPALEFAGRTFEAGVQGAGIGAVFGGLAEGTPEGAAQGAGAGFALGTGFGTVGRAVGFRAKLEAKRQADLNRWFAGKSPEEQAQLHALGMDRNQALRLATTEEFVRGMRGANGESDVRFQYVDNATFERAFGTSAKGAEHIAADQPVIVINVDRANGRTPLHEAMHGLLDLGLSPEVKTELQRKLFTQQAPDGTVLTEGVFSFDDQQRSLQQYTARLAPQARAEFNLQTPAEQLAKIRTEMAAEAFANLVEGKGPDYLLKGLTGVRRRMADSLVQAQQGTILRMMRQGLEALGVKFDSSGAPSELFVKNGRPVTNSPEVDAALRDYLRAKTKVLNRLAAADDAPSSLVVTRQDMMSKNARAVAELFKDNDNFKKDAQGNVVIERGLPVLNTPREIAKVQSKRVEEIISALERSPKASPNNARQPMRLKENGAWEGHYFTPEQLAEIDRIPDSVIAPSLKAKIRQLNDLHAPGDGRRYIIDYNAATKEAKGGGRVYSSSISSTLRDVVPLTFHVSKAGNFYTTTLDTTAMHAKLNRWFKDHRRVFDAWGGNRDAFVADVFKYLDNHASDRPGSYGLDAGAATAVHKKNVINDLFGVARGSGANPLDLSTKAGKDNLIKSFRLDRTNRITESGGEKMPFDYYKAKANLLPDEQSKVPPRFALKKPIIGPSGAGIVGYEWRSTMGEKWSQREGGYVEARVSDWDNSDSSKGTGRDIVHVYYVKHPDGHVSIEGVRSAQNILGISETRLQTIAKKARAEQAYAEHQEKAHIDNLASAAEPGQAEANRRYRKQNYSPMRSFEENEAIFQKATLYEKDGKFVRTGTPQDLMLRYEWTPVKPPSFAQPAAASANLLPAGKKMPFDYYKAKANLLPDESVVYESEPSSYGSRYIYAMVEGRPFVVRISDHENTRQVKGGDWRRGESALKKASGEEHHDTLTILTKTPSDVSVQDAITIAREAVVRDRTEYETPAAVGEMENAPVSYWKWKQNASESGTSRTIAGDSLKSASPNQIQTEPRMVTGGAETTRPPANVNLLPAGKKMPFDYYKAKANLLPDELASDGVNDTLGRAQNPVKPTARRAAQSQIESAANLTRGTPAPVPDTGGSALARRARILAEEGRLKKWAAENGKLKGKLPTEQARGSEHTVQLGEGTARVIKATRPDSHRGYGIAMGDNDRGATPSEYLDRIAQQNRLFEDDIRLERIVSNGGKLSIVISQPFIKGRAATPPEIDAYMAGKGMEKVAAGTYYLPGEQLLITDAHPKNVRVDGNGIIHPIDPVIQRADAEFVSFLRSAPHLIDANFLPAGKEWHATTPSAGLPVKGKYELREAKDLVTSFDAGFDPALQPRDRTREASVNQIAGIVQKFEPQRLGEAPTTDLGAPVIDDAGQVLSGNGRVTSLRTIYGAQDASRGEGYKQFLMQNAEQFGFKPADIAAMKEPVLVRRVEDFGGLAKAEFARQSNQSQLLAMSGAEKAAADARLLTEHPDILDKFAPSEEGNVMATSNHEFLNHFIAATGDQAELLSGKGYNNELVRKRVETAILATVIGPENRKLITQMIERADKFKMRKAVNGLMMSAPSLVKLKGTAYDLSAYLSQAMGDLVRMRGASENVETFLASKPLVGDDGRTAASDHILEFLSKAKSQKQVAEDLRRYLFMAKNAISDAQSGGLFGDTPRSREQLLGEIYGRIIRPAEPAAVAAPAAPSAFADLIPVEAAQPAPSPAPVAAQPVAPPAAVRPAPVAPSGVTAPPTPPPRPRNAVVADWSFHKGTPRLMAGAGGFMPTGSALRASASEIVHHTREQAAYDFAERMEGMPRSAGARLARDFIRKAEARQMPSLPATERTRRAAAALAIIPPAEVASQLIQGGLNGAQRHMETYLPASSTR